MTATTSQHIAARGDRDLLARLQAAAEQAGKAVSLSEIEQRMGSIISAEIEVGGETTTITDVHAYAAGVREDLLMDERLLSPGLNPGAVTDPHLVAALTVVGILP